MSLTVETGSPESITSQKVEDDIAEVTRVAIREFMRKVNVTPAKCDSDVELESKVAAITQTWPFKDQISKHIATGLLMAKMTFRHVSDVDNRVAIALYTALFLSLDDPERFDSLEAQEFWRGACDGSLLKDSGLLGEFTRVILGMSRFYSNYSSGAILASTIRFLNGEMTGNPENSAFVDPVCLEFVDYSRLMTGCAESYTAFIWSKGDFPDEYSYIQVSQDVCDYLDHTNDILSFYKEEQDGEVASYIHARARVTGKSLTATLYDVIDKVVAAAERIRRILGDGEARKAWDSVERGYIGFHIESPRYRLQEVFGSGMHTVDSALIARF